MTNTMTEKLVTITLELTGTEQDIIRTALRMYARDCEAQARKLEAVESNTFEANTARGLADRVRVAYKEGK